MPRPATPARQRRSAATLAKAIASLVLLVLIAAACSSDGFPESYSDQIDEASGLSNVELNWIEGCEVGLATSDLATDANNVCACSFNEISGADGIAFEDFLELDDELKGDPTTLADSEQLTPIENRVLEIVRSCIASG